MSLKASSLEHAILLDILFSMNVWKAIYRVSWIILAALILAGVVCIFGPKFSSLRKMQKDKNELKKENQRLETEITMLRTKQERFTSEPDFVERTAKEMGMIRTNEIVFKFEDSEAAKNDQH